MRGSGLRWTVEQLGPEAAERVKRDNLDWARTNAVDSVETNVTTPWRPSRLIARTFAMAEQAGPILSTAGRIARVAKRVLAADGVTLRQNNDAASDQHLFHFHLHVIPRFAGDGERFNTQLRQISVEEQEAMGERLRRGLV